MVLQSHFSARLAVASSSAQGAGTRRGWGLGGAGADGFGLRADRVVQRDLKGEKKGEMDFLSDYLAIARVL